MGTAAPPSRPRRPLDGPSSRRPGPPPGPGPRGDYYDDHDDDYGDDYDDDELDGFIDDGPIDGGVEEWRREIRKISGYDPSRYKDDWGDDRMMEASWAQVQAEEKRSARAGREEDIREEMEELKRLKTKAAKKRKRGLDSGSDSDD